MSILQQVLNIDQCKLNNQLMSVICIHQFKLYQKCMKVLWGLRYKNTNLDIVLQFLIILIHIIFTIIILFLIYSNNPILLCKHSINLYFKDKHKCSNPNLYKRLILLMLTSNCKLIDYILMLLQLFLYYCIPMECKMYQPNLSITQLMRDQLLTTQNFSIVLRKNNISY